MGLLTKAIGVYAAVSVAKLVTAGTTVAVIAGIATYTVTTTIIYSLDYAMASIAKNNNTK